MLHSPLDVQSHLDQWLVDLGIRLDDELLVGLVRFVLVDKDYLVYAHQATVEMTLPQMARERTTDVLPQPVEIDPLRQQPGRDVIEALDTPSPEELVPVPPGHPLQEPVEFVHMNARVGPLREQAGSLLAHRAEPDALDLQPLAVGRVQLSVAVPDDVELLGQVHRHLAVLDLPPGRSAVRALLRRGLHPRPLAGDALPPAVESPQSPHPSLPLGVDVVALLEDRLKAHPRRLLGLCCTRDSQVCRAWAER